MCNKKYSHEYYEALEPLGIEKFRSKAQRAQYIQPTPLSFDTNNYIDRFFQRLRNAGDAIFRRLAVVKKKLGVKRVKAAKPW